MQRALVYPSDLAGTYSILRPMYPEVQTHTLASSFHWFCGACLPSFCFALSSWPGDGYLPACMHAIDGTDIRAYGMECDGHDATGELSTLSCAGSQVSDCHLLNASPFAAPQPSLLQVHHRHPLCCHSQVPRSHRHVRRAAAGAAAAPAVRATATTAGAARAAAARVARHPPTDMPAAVFHQQLLIGHQFGIAMHETLAAARPNAPFTQASGNL